MNQFSKNKLPKRKSIRLPEYDYSQFGYYFITICTQDREMYFANNNIKQMIDNKWQELKNKFLNINLNEYAIMPNHFHGIIVINNDDICRGDPCGRPNGGQAQHNNGQARPAPTK